MCVAWLAAFLGATCFACFTIDLDGFSGGTAVGAGSDGGSDGQDSAVDAGPPPDGAPADSAIVDGTVSTFDGGHVHEGDFENATASGCGARWRIDGPGTLAASNVAHSGSWSCLVCSTSTLPNGNVYLRPTTPLVSGTAGQTYRAEAWVRTAPSGTTPATLRMGMEMAGSYQAPTTPPPLANWDVRTVTWTLPSSGDVSLFIRMDDPNQGDCFIVDDVSVFKL
jgi:hypothetical protein